LFEPLQLPLAHSVPTVHVCPAFNRQAPAASQVLVAEGHESLSEALLTMEQVPGTAPSQAMQTLIASHATLQHTPSAQNVL
jgi:hypothetical protein